ncbi:cobalt-precorrin-4 C(11)-methyltransferase, partial [Klebsiella pneumoniae]|nr:cobalt-precorrin-4 C(11)-methyltransferase [Klebsiella pneumoniae]MDN7208823.1 cobalt-precorrin-4 C(11)-methyltransferase [Klebsiella pneumoniae]
ESQTVRGTLADIGDKVRDAGIRKTALILVGPFLGDEYHYSKLYAADFSHEYRKA